MVPRVDGGTSDIDNAKVRQAPASRVGNALEPLPTEDPREAILERDIDWRQLVPARFQREFGALTEDLFLALAEQAPASLARLLLTEGALNSGELSLAAEAMGGAEDERLVRWSLAPLLLSHRSPVVREGAMYGLACLGTPDIRRTIKTVARVDRNPAVRQAAGAVLAGWEEQCESPGP